MSTTSKIGAFGWPPFLSTAIAAAYSGVSKWTIRRAAQRGELAIAGRRGRSLTFRREDVDRWLLGEGVTPPTSPAPRRTLAATTPRQALERLDRLRGSRRGKAG